MLTVEVSQWSAQMTTGLGEHINGSMETRHMIGHSTLGIHWAFVAYDDMLNIHLMNAICTATCYYGR